MSFGWYPFQVVHLKESVTHLNGLNGWKNGKGLHLGLQLGFTFFPLQKRNVLVGFTLGFTFWGYFLAIYLSIPVSYTHLRAHET